MRPINVFALLAFVAMGLMGIAAISKSQVVMDISGVFMIILAAVAVIFAVMVIKHLLWERFGWGKK